MVGLCHTPTAGQSRKNKARCTGHGTAKFIHRETMTNERTGKTDVERGKKPNLQPYNVCSHPNLHYFLCLEAILGDSGRHVQL